MVTNGIYYDTCGLYFASKTDARDKIAAIDAVIDALLTTVLTNITKAPISEYMLNDGQTIIKEVYRDPNKVVEVINTLKMIKQQYANDINGRVHTLISGKNLLPRRGGFGY